MRRISVWSLPGGMCPACCRMSSCPVMTLKPFATPRCVTGIPAAAGTEMAEVTPGTTSTAMPWSRQ